jgi:hypothetical protein
MNARLLRMRILLSAVVAMHTAGWPVVGAEPLRLIVELLPDRGVRLVWPVTDQYLLLEETTSLSPPVVWLPSAQSITSKAGDFSTVVGLESGTRFFRLQETAWSFPVLGGGDADHDGLPDSIELQLGLDPEQPDSDGDGWPDEAELAGRGNPLNPATTPIRGVVGKPLVRVIAPAIGSTGGLPSSTLVAQPPLRLVAPALGNNDGLPFNTLVAQPPLILRPH